MFEQELELEKRNSWGPLILVICLIGAVIGGIGYYAYQMKKGLSQQEATTLINQVLADRTSKVHFHLGNINRSVDEQPTDPHYKMLEKVGVLKVVDNKKGGIVASLTSTGEKEISAFPDFKRWKNPDNTESVDLPLATRKLVSVDNITMAGPSAAKVEYTWKWEPNRIGKAFDAESDVIKTFNTWDRGKLIDKYGADFFNAAPKHEVVTMVKGDKGWAIQ